MNSRYMSTSISVKLLKMSKLIDKTQHHLAEADKDPACMTVPLRVLPSCAFGLLACLPQAPSSGKTENPPVTGPGLGHSPVATPGEGSFHPLC